MQQEERRVIGADELVAKRIEELAKKARQVPNDGFQAGLSAANLDLTEECEQDEEGGSVIKASPAGEEAGLAANGNAAAIIAQAKEEARLLLQEAEKQAEALKQEAAASAEREKQQILEQARAAGREEGLEEVRAKNSRLEKEWQQKGRQLEASYQAKMEELEPQFVDTITGIYEHIFHVELASCREILTWLIASTMRNVEGCRSFFVHVSKDDYEYVSSKKQEILTEAATGNITLDVIADVTLSQNDCLIETDSGIFDCGLGTQLSELRRKLKLLCYEK